jgi:hypothetical protein
VPSSERCPKCGMTQYMLVWDEVCAKCRIIELTQRLAAAEKRAAEATEVAELLKQATGHLEQTLPWRSHAPELYLSSASGWLKTNKGRIEHLLARHSPPPAEAE